jgi:hypothetical protein
MGLFGRKRRESLPPSGAGAQDWSEWMADRLPPEAQDAYRHAAGDDQASSPTARDHFAASLERAAGEPAPSGKVRGVAKIVAGKQERVEERRPSDWWRGVVLEVHVPGRDAYEVEVGTLHVRRFDAMDAGYPVLIDAGDQTDIEVLFDEMPETTEAAGQRVQEGLQSAMAGIGSAESQALLASLNAVTDPGQKAQLAERLRAMGYEIPPEAGA